MDEKKYLLHFCVLPILITILSISSIARGDCWSQSDWSGGDGWSAWSDSTGYYEGSGVHGWREPGLLTLYAPDYENFYSLGCLEGAIGIYSIISDDFRTYYAGSGNTEPGSGKICVSKDFGMTWNCRIIDTTSINPHKITCMFIPYIWDSVLIGSGIGASRILKAKTLEDSIWKLSGQLSGSYVSEIIEVPSGYFLASTVHTSNGAGKIWQMFPGIASTWSPLPIPKQPNIDSICPAGIFQFKIGEDDTAFVSTYYKYGSNNIAKIFRSHALGNWVLCADLPDTLCNPFALDIGYDTLGNYGVVYVGIGDVVGKVFRSVDKGNSWEECGSLGSAWSVDEVIVDGDGTVYASAFSQDGFDFVVNVYRSTNMGISWDSLRLPADSILTNVPTSFHQTEKGFLLVGTEHTGEVFKAGYTDSGYLISSVYDVGTANGSSEFGMISWQESLNNQSLTVKVRTDNVDSMVNAPSWSLCQPCTNWQDISSKPSVTDGHRYLQYRVGFESDSVDFSPVLEDISIFYTIDTFPPCIDTAYATDGSSLITGIDEDDSVVIIFDDQTNTPGINSGNINSILGLSNSHSWLDGSGYVYTEWVNSLKLRIFWGTTIVGQPTVQVGDTIYPDTVSILDNWGNASKQPAVITGSFNPPGVDVDKSDGGSLEKVLVSPSLAKNMFTVRVHLSHDSHVRISLYDLSGRCVESLLEERVVSGIHDFTFRRENLPSSVYFIRTDINKTSYFNKVAIIK
jgi:hypothetical protein